MGFRSIAAAREPRAFRAALRGGEAAVRRRRGAATRALGRLSHRPGADRVLERPPAPPSRTPAVHAQRRRLEREAALPMKERAISQSERAKLTARAALASIAMAIILIALKSYAALQTSSMAMLGSLADSGLDLVASLVVLLGVRIAAQPADYDHRFGHGKAEALASLVQVILITLSAVFIGFRAVQRLLSGAQTAEAELGIGVSIVAMVLTVALISYQRHVVRRTGSLAIGTDRLHYSSDLLLNGSVIVALVLDPYAGLAGAGALFGALIVLWVLWGAWTASSHAL